MAGRIAGIKDVARTAGVSVGTVSNVLNRPDTVTEQTRQRVHAAVEQFGYVRSESARQLRAGASRIIGLLVLDLGNPFFADIARGAERAARAAGLRVMVCKMGRLPGDLLLRKASGEHEGAHEHRHVVLSPELVVRDSSMHRRANGREA